MDHPLNESHQARPGGMLQELSLVRLYGKWADQGCQGTYVEVTTSDIAE